MSVCGQCCVKWSVPSHIETKTLTAVAISIIYKHLLTFRLDIAAAMICFSRSILVRECRDWQCKCVLYAHELVTYFIITETLCSHFLCQQKCIFRRTIPPSYKGNTILMLCHSCTHDKSIFARYSAEPSLCSFLIQHFWCYIRSFARTRHTHRTQGY